MTRHQPDQPIASGERHRAAPGGRVTCAHHRVTPLSEIAFTKFIEVLHGTLRDHAPPQVRTNNRDQEHQRALT